MKKYKTAIFKASDETYKEITELTAEEILELKDKYKNAIIINEKPYWTNIKDIRIEVIIYDNYLE